MQDQIRILFADDHIPDKEVSNLNTCAEIREVLKKRNRGNINAWTDAYYNASEVIRALESPKYHLIALFAAYNCSETIAVGPPRGST